MDWANGFVSLLRRDRHVAPDPWARAQARARASSSSDESPRPRGGGGGWRWERKNQAGQGRTGGGKSLGHGQRTKPLSVSAWVGKEKKKASQDEDDKFPVIWKHRASLDLISFFFYFSGNELMMK